jgi:hypothetical protein
MFIYARSCCLGSHFRYPILYYVSTHVPCREHPEYWFLFCQQSYIYAKPSLFMPYMSNSTPRPIWDESSCSIVQVRPISSGPGLTSSIRAAVQMLLWTMRLAGFYATSNNSFAGFTPKDCPRFQVQFPGRTQIARLELFYRSNCFTRD